MALACKKTTITGKNVILEFAIACGDADPATLNWLPLGYMRNKDETMSLDTIDTTTDSSTGSFRESDITYKTFEISGDGLVRGDSQISNQQLLKDHVYNDPTPYAWFRMTSPVDTVVAFCVVTEYSTSSPYDDSATYNISASATGRPDGLPSVIYTVTPQPPTSVTVLPATASVEVGDTVELEASVLPVAAPQSVVWTSSNLAVATVSAGVVTGVSAGSATITARSAVDGSKSATATITVTA